MSNSALKQSADMILDQYTMEDIEAMDTNALLSLYKQTGQEELKWPLVMRYTNMIKSIALQICGIYSSFAQVDDIINEGVITLLGAVDRFEPDKGIKFETFVSKRIRGMIIDLARRQDWIPRSLRKRSRDIDQAITQLHSELGRMPNDLEVCRRLDIPLAKYREDMLNLDLSNVLSLETLIEAKEQGNASVSIPSKDLTAQPELHLQEKEFHKKLEDGIKTLRENEQLVLSLYYQEELNMREISHVMEISEPRVSQIHSKAIQKLRFYMQNYLNGAG